MLLRPGGNRGSDECQRAGACGRVQGRQLRLSKTFDVVGMTRSLGAGLSTLPVCLSFTFAVVDRLHLAASTPSLQKRIPSRRGAKLFARARGCGILAAAAYRARRYAKAAELS